MDHLDETSIEELQDDLEKIEETKSTQRLIATIAYKNGVTQTGLAEWHGTGRRTIYSWLMRLETDESLEPSIDCPSLNAIPLGYFNLRDAIFIHYCRKSR